LQNLEFCVLAGTTRLKYCGRMTYPGDILASELAPFSVDDLPASRDGEMTRISGTDRIALIREKSPEHRPTSYVRGLSLSAVLQILHLGRVW
jgi:hypothetical protein